MAVPSKQAYLDALATIAAGDKSVLDTVGPILNPVTKALDKAVIDMDAALAKYSPPEGSPASGVRTQLDSWRNTMFSFLGSLKSMELDYTTRMATFDTPAEPAAE